jgi:truncated hemoglobin YjbI
LKGNERVGGRPPRHAQGYQQQGQVAELVIAGANPTHVAFTGRQTTGTRARSHCRLPRHPTTQTVSVAVAKISPAEFDEVAAELGRTLDFFKVPAQEKKEVLAAFAAHKDEVTAGYVAASKKGR